MRTNELIYLKDFYKVGHVHQYPKGTELIFSNFTPRKSLINGVNHSVLFGLKYFIQKYLIHGMKTDVYPEDEYIDYNYLIEQTLGVGNPNDHIGQLLHFGYLPLAIYALSEKSVVPCGVPALVVYNTHPDFYWLPNMIETILSCTLWGPSTSATIAREYRVLLDEFAKDTSSCPEFVDYQAHDFSMRGMYGLEAAKMSGAAHLQYFKGTDTIPAIIFNNEYYGAPIGFSSVPATEHSVMSAGGHDNEFETFKRLITEVYPSGIVSIVSDTWDLWRVIDEYLPRLKSDIMARDGKLVIRPDSGDPVEIICGKILHQDKDNPTVHQKGVVARLWDIFGGTINDKGYKELDSHIGCIYGDSITLDRARKILQGLKDEGFSSTNIVFGVGSYTYQYNTRDTFGWAMKATYAEINGKCHAITKNPITDSGTKKSHSGILKVVKDGDSFRVLQNQTWEQFHQDDNELKLVFKDGVSMI
jgi:nicotinamide phosphoribosyltransferase